jgi:hypothetical protein
MIGKKDTFAIFESYQQHLKEQQENSVQPQAVLSALADLVLKYKSELPGDEAMKLSQFLTDPQTLKSYQAFNVSPLKMQSSPVGGETDASAVNMGQGGVLEVQPDGQYPR